MKIKNMVRLYNEAEGEFYRTHREQIKDIRIIKKDENETTFEITGKSSNKKETIKIKSFMKEE